eukprot:3440837-Pyramimonas_sp.AAC.1
MSHYIRCPHLWQAVSTVWHSQLRNPQSILDRLGLCSGESDELPQRLALERTVIAFHTYNIQAKFPIIRCPKRPWA